MTLEEDPMDHNAQQLLLLSAKTPEALSALAGRYDAFFESNPRVCLPDACHAAAVGRNHFAQRAAIIATTTCQTRNLLTSFCQERPAPGLFVGATASAPNVAWLFPGQGCQYFRMARELYDSQPIVRRSLTHFDEILRDELNLPLLKAIFDDEALLSDTAYAQPAIFAVEMSLASLWQDYGLQPDVLVGHSVGQYAAACIAEVFSPEDGARLIARRAKLMAALTEAGAMSAIFADPERVQEEIAGIPQLSIAAYNGAHVVVSGPTQKVQEVVKRLEEQGIRCQPLKASHAFHSQLMDSMLDDFEAFARTIHYGPPQRSLIDGLTGRLFRTDSTTDAKYWCRHTREAVQFSKSIDTLGLLGCNVLLEVGPQPILTAMALRAWPKGTEKPQAIPTLREGAHDANQVVEALARLYTAGATLTFPRSGSARNFSLPTYPFQRQQYWLTSTGKEQVSGPQKPTAPSHKADFNLLQRLLEAAPDSRPMMVAEQLQAELQQILCLPEPPGRKVRFAQLGIDSLMATQFLVRLQEVLRIRIDEAAFYRVSTIDELAALIATDDRALSALLESAPDENVPASGIPAASSYERNWLEASGLTQMRRVMESWGIPNPYFRRNESVANNTTVVDGVTLIDFSNYNYLGLSGDPRVARAVNQAVSRYGTSVSASRVISGEKPIHQDLETALAHLLGVEAAIVLVSGHATNVTVIGHLFGPADLVVYDSLAHNSIMQGVQLSRAKAIAFQHNNVEALEDILGRTRGRFRQTLIAIEGVYSMDGDIPNLPAIVDAKERFGARLLVDEAHSLGVLGKSGRGIAEHFGVCPKRVDLWMGTLSKTLASCGGYIGGSRELVECLKYTAPGFVFSAGITPANTAAALEACILLGQEPWRVEKLQENARTFLRAAREHTLETGTSEGTAIVPVIVGDSRRCLHLADLLFRRGINVYPIVYPAVPNEQSRLRFFINSCHTTDELLHSVRVVAEESSTLPDVLH
jgi:8-amino-7-oxononanoate synthase